MSPTARPTRPCPRSLAPDAADARGSGAADRRARRQGPAGEEGQGPQGAREEGPAKKKAARNDPDRAHAGARRRRAGAARRRRRAERRPMPIIISAISTALDPREGWRRTIERAPLPPGQRRRPRAAHPSADRHGHHPLCRPLHRRRRVRQLGRARRAGDLPAAAPDPRLAGGRAADGASATASSSRSPTTSPTARRRAGRSRAARPCSSPST